MLLRSAFPLALFNLEDGGGSAPAPAAVSEAPSAAPEAPAGHVAPKAEAPAPEVPNEPEKTPEQQLDDELAAVWNKAQGPERDENGRFKSNKPTVEGEEPPVEQANTGDEPGDPGQPESETDGELTDIDPSAIATLPNSWPKDKAKIWAALPPDARDYLAARETEVQAVMSRQGREVNAFREFKPVFDAVTPFKQYLMEVGRHVGASPAQLIQQTLSFENMLRTGTNEQKLTVLRDIIGSYGIDLEPLFGADGKAIAQSGPVADPRVDHLAKQLERVTSHLTAQQRQAEEAEQALVAAQVKEFASDKKSYPYYEKVKPYMAKLLENELAADLKEAYAIACQAVPEVKKAVEADRLKQQMAETEAQRNAKATQARQATSINVRSAPSSPKAKTIDDSLNTIADRFYGRR